MHVDIIFTKYFSMSTKCSDFDRSAIFSFSIQNIDFPLLNAFIEFLILSCSFIKKTEVKNASIIFTSTGTRIL